MIKIVTKTKKKLTKATNVKAVVKSNRKKSVGRKSVGRKLVKKPHTRKKATLFVPTNNREKLVDLGLMKPQSHISETRPTLTVIHKMNHLSGRQYEIENEPTCVSTVLKFVLKVHQTNELSES